MQAGEEIVLSTKRHGPNRILPAALKIEQRDCRSQAAIARVGFELRPLHQRITDGFAGFRGF